MLTVIITSHKNPEGLKRIIENLNRQTRQPDEVIITYSDQECGIIKGYKYVEDINRNDWGHEKRAKGLELATQEYITWWNSDDSYEDTFIEKMLTGNDVTYCAWSGNHKPQFHLGSSTSGNFIVKTEIARKAGYNSRAYEADGILINDISNLTKDIHYIDEVLYHHNR
jgi:hypothetical protein